MAFDNIDMDSEEDLGVEDVTPPEAPSNRPFFVVAGILGAITLLAVACIAVYALWYLPQQNKKEAAQLEEINTQNTAIAESLIQTQVASAYTETPTPTEEIVPTATSTPVVVEATEVVAPIDATQDPRTATVAALLTQAAEAQATSAATSAVVATTTELPTTGFADEVGIPGLFGMAVVLLVVIFLARRIRMAN